MSAQRDPLEMLMAAAYARAATSLEALQNLRIITSGEDPALVEALRRLDDSYRSYKGLTNDAPGLLEL